MASKTDKQADAWMRGQVHRPPSTPRAETTPTASQQFTATLRQEARRGWHTSTIAPKEAEANENA